MFRERKQCVYKLKRKNNNELATKINTHTQTRTNVNRSGSGGLSPDERASEQAAGPGDHQQLQQRRRHAPLVLRRKRPLGECVMEERLGAGLTQRASRPAAVRAAYLCLPPRLPRG